MKGKLTYEKGAFSAAFMRSEKPIATAATLAVGDAGAELKSTARASIAGAGFSRKWQNALRVDQYPKGRISINAAAHVYHKISYAHVFEKATGEKAHPQDFSRSPPIREETGRAGVARDAHQGLQDDEQKAPDGQGIGKSAFARDIRHRGRQIGPGLFRYKHRAN